MDSSKKEFIYISDRSLEGVTTCYYCKHEFKFEDYKEAPNKEIYYDCEMCGARIFLVTFS